MSKPKAFCYGCGDLLSDCRCGLAVSRQNFTHLKDVSRKETDVRVDDKPKELTLVELMKELTTMLNFLDAIENVNEEKRALYKSLVADIEMRIDKIKFEDAETCQ